MSGLVLVACEYSGTVRDAFLRAGIPAVSCDLLPCESEAWSKTHLDGLPYGGHYQGSVFDIIEEQPWTMMIAHPPCTHLSVSGARWFPPHTQPGEPGFKPLHLRFEALAFVDRLMHSSIPLIAIENPLSVISGQIRKADQSIQPWQFGHTESKRTCLWLKNLPLLEHTENVYDEMMLLPLKVRNRIHWLGSNSGKERSKFYTGFAEAMAQQWGPLAMNPIL